MKASDLLVRCLEREGITHVFGVPGEENADFMLSLQESNIQFVLTRHEQGAAFMAEVQGRLTGSPAVCLGTLGPGATNLITGVANANMDRAPLIVITGQASTGRQHKESHQVMDVVDMYQPVTKWTQSIENADAIPEMVRKAMRVARTEKPGAVHLELPEDVAAHETQAQPLEPNRYRHPRADERSVDLAWQRIRRARKPLVLAGNGVIRTNASDALRRFCQATGIGAMSTFMAKGCVDRESEHCLFTIGLQQKDYPALAIEEADLVLSLGYDLVEYPPRLWNPGGGTPVIHCDSEGAEIDADYQPEIEVVGTLPHTLNALTDRVEQDGAPEFDLSYQREMRARMLDDFREHAEDAATGQIKPQKVLWDVGQVLGPDDLLLSGVGAHKMWIGRYYHCREPNTCIIPNGFCSMGLPLPGAIGAALLDASPGAPGRILAIAGDGDFLMNVQEMETARRLDADITVMVWVDGGYGLISWKQESEFDRSTDLSFGNPDWLELASSFGWHGQVVDDSTKLRDALQTALDHPGPSLLAVPIDYRENLKLGERLGDLQVAL